MIRHLVAGVKHAFGLHRPGRKLPVLPQRHFARFLSEIGKYVAAIPHCEPRLIRIVRSASAICTNWYSILRLA